MATDNNWSGAALSLLLHGAVLLLLALLWSVLRPGAAPPRPPDAVPIDIVEMGDETASPEGGKTPVPQERAPETAEHPSSRRGCDRGRPCARR